MINKLGSLLQLTLKVFKRPLHRVRHGEEHSEEAIQKDVQPAFHSSRHDKLTALCSGLFNTLKGFFKNRLQIFILIPVVVFCLTFIGVIYWYYTYSTPSLEEIALTLPQETHEQPIQEQELTPSLTWPSNRYAPRSILSTPKIGLIIVNITGVDKKSWDIINQFSFPVTVSLHPLENMELLKEISKSSILATLVLEDSDKKTYGIHDKTLLIETHFNELNRRLDNIILPFKNHIPHFLEGFLIIGGDLFFLSVQSVYHLMTYIQEKKRYLIDVSMMVNPFIEQAAFSKNISYLKADFFIHDKESQDHIAIILKNCEILSEMTGRSLLVVSAHPMILTQVKDWVVQLNSKNIEIVAISELVAER
ncbi:MAG: divergent polysaccharide deacetylase family protein [Proteobacteria bacterium]|nr:divergent polysaccharide deacetylase family protein [Pseudomonadota bacterium]